MTLQTPRNGDDINSSSSGDCRVGHVDDGKIGGVVILVLQRLCLLVAVALNQLPVAVKVEMAEDRHVECLRIRSEPTHKPREETSWRFD